MTTIQEIVGAIWDAIINRFILAFQFIQSILGVFGSLFTGDWEKIKAALLNVVTTLWEGITNVFTADIGVVLTITAGLRDRIGEFFRTAANNVLGFVEGMANGVIGAINAIISAWNNLELSLGGQRVELPFGQSFEIPSITLATPDVGTIPTVSLPRIAAAASEAAFEDIVGDGIPGLASGGIVTSPTLALIGEGGPEAVVPLGRGGGEPMPVYLVINGEEIQGALYRGNAEYGQVNGL